MRLRIPGPGHSKQRVGSSLPRRIPGRAIFLSLLRAVEGRTSTEISAKRAEIAIVGAGIIGLAHAYLAARAGKKVAVFERNPAALGASIRNLGMIWPIGQPHGPLHALAIRSRPVWLGVLQEAGLPFSPSGAFALDFGGKQASAASSGIIDGVGYLGGVFAGNGVARLAVAFGWRGVFLAFALVSALSALAAGYLYLHLRAQQRIRHGAA